MFCVVDNTNQVVYAQFLTFNHAAIWAARELKGIDWKVMIFKDFVSA